MGNEREYVLRPLCIADAPLAAALIRHAFATQGVATDPPPSALRESADSVRANLTTDGGAGAWVADALAACVLWQVQPRGLYLGRLAVHPDHRGQGIARALVARVEVEARAKGLPRLLLSTRLMLAGNQRLFAACGFRETAQHAHPGYAHTTFVDMEKPVAPE